MRTILNVPSEASLLINDTGHEEGTDNGFAIVSEGSYLSVTGRGFFSKDQVVLHFRALSHQLAVRRRVGASVKVLVDLRKAAVQSQEVTATISRLTATAYNDVDRVAIIVATSLQKIQLKRMHPEEHFGIFLSQGAALEHLSRNSMVAG